MGKYGRLDAFTRGQIFGLRQGGAGRLEITRLVKKKDGKHPTVRTVDNIFCARRRMTPLGTARTHVLAGAPLRFPKATLVPLRAWCSESGARLL